MRSTKTRLEQEVIKNARIYAKSLDSGDWILLMAAIRDLDDYLADISDKAGAFNPGSPTSEAAALSSRLIAGSARHRIVSEIRSVGFNSALIGLTDDELERRLNKPHTTISSARNWLVQAGWLTDSGVTRLTRGRREAAVWKLTEAAERAVREPAWAEKEK